MNISTRNSIRMNIMKSVIETSLDRFNGARTITIKFFRGGDRSCLFSADDQRYKEEDNMDFIGFFGPKWCGVCVVVCSSKVHHRHQQCTLVHGVSK